MLSATATKLNTAKTLHGLFDLTINGQSINGVVNTEIWNAMPNKNRTEVLQSNIGQFAAPGAITVTDGKTLWQYDPTKKVVYTGPLPASTTGTLNGGAPAGTGNGSRFLLTLIQTVFTRSTATMKADATVKGKSVYDVHVTPQDQATGGTSDGGTGAGVGSFSYDGDVFIDKNTQLPIEINLTIQGLGKVLVDIPTLDVNKLFPDSTFTFTPPAGTKVLPLQAASSTPSSGSLSLVQAQQQAGYHLLSIPGDQADYVLQGVNALGSPGNQIYTLNYMKGNLSFTIAQGKALANLPGSGQQVSVRGTTGTLSNANGVVTLAWTEKGVGIRITGPFSSDQAQQIASLLS